MNGKRHEFALFSKEFSYAVQEKKNLVIVTEPTILHRLQHVLRLEKGETVVLFDDTMHAPCTLIEYGKGTAKFALGSVQKNTPIMPKLTVILPLLKREAVDEVVYACRELGVSQIAFVSTEKTSRHELAAGEWERLERVSIAAAEQSKNFYPTVFLAGSGKKVVPSLTDFLASQTFGQAIKLYADPTGSLWYQIVSSFPEDENGTEIFVCIGPEGDLTDQEKEALRSAGFIFCQLGKTILRAQQAAVLMAGLVRTTIG